MSPSSDEVVHYKKDSVLYSEGEPAHFLYLVKSGEINLVKENDGRFTLLELVGDISFVGENALFSDQVRKESAIVTKNTEVILVKANDIGKVMNSLPDWSREILSTFSKRIEKLSSYMAEHKISGNLSGQNLTNEQEHHFRDLIKEYKEVKNL